MNDAPSYAIKVTTTTCLMDDDGVMDEDDLGLLNGTQMNVICLQAKNKQLAGGVTLGKRKANNMMIQTLALCSPYIQW